MQRTYAFCLDLVDALDADLAGREPATGSTPPRRPRLSLAQPASSRSFAKATNQSNASGLASESRAAALSGSPPISTFLTGTSSTLPDSVRGTSVDGDHLVGHVARRAVLADARAQRLDDVVGQLRALVEHDEQRHPVLAGRSRPDVDDQRVRHRVDAPARPR